MNSSIVRRIIERTGVPALDTVLAETLSPSELQSLLLAVYQRRAGRTGVADLMRDAANRPLVSASDVDARALNTFDRVAFESARAFEAVELSPVGPFATSAVLGSIDQNSVLTTIRAAEVLGDSTPALALASALRRRTPASRGDQPVRFCSSHRVVRLQPFDVPGFTPHFRLFCLATAGRDTGSDGFEIASLREHVEAYLRLFRSLSAEGFDLSQPLVEISDTRITEALLAASPGAREAVRESVRAHRPGASARVVESFGLTLPSAIVDPAPELDRLAAAHGVARERFRLATVKAHVVDELSPRYPEAQFRFNLARLEGLGYYDGLCLRVSPVAPGGDRYPIVDGGFSDWTARLLQDRKERLLATGIGSEFVCRRYRRAV
jgi:hypothetical protein